MAKIKYEKNLDIDNQVQSLNISEEQIEILARRLLPEIKKFFADDKIRNEFEEWKKKKQNTNIN